MATTEKSETAGAATPAASKPIHHLTDQKGSTSMAQPTDSTPGGTAVWRTAHCGCGSTLVITGDSSDDDAAIDEWREAHDRCQPVDLDALDYSTAEARFAALVNEREILHDGDAEKVMPFPRPSWSDPEYDSIGHSVETSYYASPPVWTNAAQLPGRNNIDDGILTPASARTAITRYGDGLTVVSVGMRKWYTGDAETGPRWAGVVFDFTPTEAVHLAHALLAAAELAEASR